MSAFYNKPWSSGLVSPAYTKTEDPLQRGSARTTPWLPRGTISRVPKGSKLGGYSVPAYVRREPVGSQAHTTPWLPRGTVMSMKGIKTGLPWKPTAHTLDSNGLGALGDTKQGGATVGGENPIESYGQKAATLIVQEFGAIPVGQREVELRKLLGQVDPALFSSYKRESGRLKGMGLSVNEAQRKGLAVAFSRGLTKEFMKIGKKGKVPAPGLRKGHVSLGALMGFDAQASNYQDLGGVLSTIKNTLSKLGGLACDVATHPITPIAAGAAGAYYGGPQGASTAMAGAGIAATACSSGAVPTVTAAPAGPPAWALPAILGGGALALLLVLRK